MSRFSKYPECRESNLAWFGEIPAHWEIGRLKGVISRNDSGVWGEDFDPDGTIVLRSTDVDLQGNWRIEDPARRSLSAKERDEALLLEGDLLITKSSGSVLHLGKTALVSATVSEMGCCFSNFMQRLRLKHGNEPRYFFRIMNSPVGREQLNYFGSTTTGLANLNGKIISSLCVPTVPALEQHAISDFLDRETAKLDALIAKKVRLIELLQEKRAALITHAVTKGLNPDVPMKDSGVEWLGEIPAHWDVVQLKRLWKRCDYGISESLAGDGEIKVLTMANIQDGRVTPPEHGCVDEVPYELILERGDLLFNRTNSRDLVAKVGIFDGTSDDMVSFASYLVRIRLKKRSIPDYYNYALNSMGVLSFARSIALLSINQANLNPNKYGHIPIPVPPVKEQEGIANSLDEETRSLEALTAKIREAIARLQEFRTALISAAVTGKIDVRGEAA